MLFSLPLAGGRNVAFKQTATSKKITAFILTLSGIAVRNRERSITAPSSVRSHQLIDI
jgi:hypothetical protein